MKTTTRRILAVVTLVFVVLGSSGCTWVIKDALALWPTKRLSGLDSRGQEASTMLGAEPAASLGGW